MFRERELHKISEAIEILDDALQVLITRLAANTDEVKRAHLALVKGRIAGLSSLARTGRKLLEAVLSGAAVDASPLKVFDASD